VALMRTQYWNVNTGTVRGGDTGHGESQTDVEDYLLPMDAARGVALHGWGVADAMTVTAAPGSAEVTVSPGFALDSSGRSIVLSVGGFAVVDQSVPAGQTLNVPTVPVTSTGVAIDTSGSTGDRVLAVGWREVIDRSQLNNTPTWLHAPWLQLLDPLTFQDDGTAVVLALVSLDTSGAVTRLTVGTRRVVGVPAGRIELRHPGQVGSPPVVDQVPGVEIAARADGGLDLNRLQTAGPSPALSVDGAGNVLLAPGGERVGIGTVAPSAALEVDRGTGNDVALALVSSGAGWGSGMQLTNLAPGARGYGTYAGADGNWHFTDVSRGVDALVIDGAGQVGIGIGGAAAQRMVHVEGSELHSGGSAGGLSFSSRDVGTFVESPDAGERWVWYADAGSARLWSGSDRLTVSASGEGGGLDVARRMRVRQGADQSAGIWYFQSGTRSDRAFVGMADDNHVGLYGAQSGWGLLMDVTNSQLTAQSSLTVAGRLSAAGLEMPANGVLAGAGRLHISGPELLFLLNTGGVVVSSAWGGNGQLSTDGPIGTDGKSPQGGLPSGWAGGVHTWDLFAEGTIGCGPAGAARGGISNNGTVWGVRKPFLIEHPLDPEGKVLSHASVEGPETAVYYRGDAELIGGTARVTLPDYFEALTRASGRTVQITAVCGTADPISVLAAGPVTDGGFDVRAADDRNPGQRFCWEVKAVRADVEQLRVEVATEGIAALLGLG
jgi:hypothetical protein